MLKAIERATRQKIEELELPTTELVNNERIARFKQKITDALATDELAFMRGVVEQYQQEHDVPAVDIAAALAQIAIGDRPLLMKSEKRRAHLQRDDAGPAAGSGRKRRDPTTMPEMERFRIEVGLIHGVRAANIVGALANEAGLDGDHIGRVDIHEDHSFVELPAGMPREVFRDLRKAWVCGQQLSISRQDQPEGASGRSDRRRKPAQAKNNTGSQKGESKGKPKGDSGRHKKKSQPKRQRKQPER